MKHHSGVQPSTFAAPLFLLLFLASSAFSGIIYPPAPDTLPRANGGTGVTSLPVCVLGSSTDQSIPNATWTKLTVWSRTATGAYDPGVMYSSGNVTVPMAGIYDVSVSGISDSNANSTILQLYLNGSALARLGNASNGQNFVSGIVTVNLSASDVLSVYMYQNAGAAINFYGNANDNKFSVRFRPAN